MPKSPLRRSPLLALTLVALLAGACVRPDDPKVGITRVEANLVFGVKEPPPGALPPNQGVGLGEGPAAPGNEGFDFPDFVARDPGRFGGLNLPATKLDCPPASNTATARDAVDVNVTGPARPGTYRWKKGGTQKPVNAPQGTPETKITGFERRLLRNVKTVSEGVTTYETLQLQGASQVVVSTFQVRTSALNRGTTDGAPVASGPRVGEPDRGVSLIKLEVLDSKGQTLSTYEPTKGVLYLPLPVASGEEYKSVGVDPKSGQTIVHQARVLGRERVDACGDVVDGWAVEATQTTSVRNSPTVQVKYKYLVALQYGGVLISEQLTYDTMEASNDFLFTLGQLDPDPLP